MNEVRITTNKMNHLIDPVLHIWGWEVPLYLFLGGLTAGVLILSSAVILSKREKECPAAANKIALWAPIFLSIGMGALGLDLEHKLYLWRFYTTFQITSPMSWGSWILLLVFPVSIFLALGTIRQGYPRFHDFLRNLWPKRLRFVQRWYDYWVNFSEQNIQLMAKLGIPCGIALGIYTGILLSTISARPFWNTSVLGLIFLASGASAGLAFTLLIAKEHKEKLFYGKLDAVVIVIELLLLGLMILTMVSSPEIKQNAAQLVLGGELTALFWGFAVVLGMLLPLVLEILEIKGFWFRRLSFISPVLVLLGGYIFRDVVVQAGQISSWIPY